MKKIKINLFLVFFAAINICKAQDPNFAQYYSSPLNVNPALTGNINADWRIIANFRDQWIGPASPYVTGTISFDRKIFQNKIKNIDEGNRFGIGAMLMYDQAMQGIAKNTYASLNLSYNVKLNEGDIVNRIGAGFGGIYARKSVDFSQLNFEEQWTGGLDGFDTNMPTGEDALSNMKGYLSLTGGLIFSRTSENSNFDIGASVFHINKPKQTFLKDENQYLPMRKVIHANYERYLNDYIVLNTNAIYQKQYEATYYSAGLGFGYYLGNTPDIIINAGLWYWSNNSITPYLGYQYDRLQLGLTYDITISKLNEAPRRANSFEISLILRGEKPPSQVIPCPWK